MAINMKDVKMTGGQVNIKLPADVQLDISGGSMDAGDTNILVTEGCPLDTTFSVRSQYAPMLKAYIEADPRTEAEAVEVARASGIERFAKAGKTIFDIGRFLFENRDWIAYMLDRFSGK